jgi:hypothetical protein
MSRADACAATKLDLVRAEVSASGVADLVAAAQMMAATLKQGAVARGGVDAERIAGQALAIERSLEQAVSSAQALQQHIQVLRTEMKAICR